LLKSVRFVTLDLFETIGEIDMSKVCPVTKKTVGKGYKYSIRGIAKKQKGIGLNITGKTKRRFRPNLQKKRMWYAEEGRFITLRLSTAGIRTIDKLGLHKVITEMRQRGESV
jgi:large subunit ribosomal protein L28